MSEKIQEQISAFLDGELPANEAELLVHRLSRDNDMHAKALSYQAIGAAMRDELLYPEPNQLRRRILGALDGEPPVDQIPQPALRARPLVRPLIGFAVAATVAMVAIISLQNMARQGDPEQAAPLVAGSGEAPPPSYVVPQESLVDGGLLRPVPIRLTNYLVNHGEYATGLGRKSIHSDIVGFRPEPGRDEDAAVTESR
jgi:sigma-E factor negative regulatory protein RseA